jgi:hypothetical protein
VYLAQLEERIRRVAYRFGKSTMILGHVRGLVTDAAPEIAARVRWKTHPAGPR